MKNAKLEMILAMIIFGTVGLVRKFVPISSGALSLFRGALAIVTLGIIMSVTHQKIHWDAVKKNAAALLVSGAFIGLNWVALFEAYNYTTVAKSVAVYYLAPLIVIVMSPLLIKEKLNPKKIVCVLVAMAGLLLVSGVLKENVSAADMKGILLALAAAVLYATVILINKKVGPEVGPYDKTVTQMAAAVIVLLPYVILTKGFPQETLTASQIALIFVMGIVHTGIAYALWFHAVGRISTQTCSVVSYLDPAVAILTSALFLREPIGPAEILGSMLIIGAAMVSEVFIKD